MSRLVCALAVLILAAGPARAGDESRQAAAGVRPEPSRPAAYLGVGAGDALGQRMFGRPLHRRRILRPHSEPLDTSAGRAPFDPQAWLDRQEPARR